MKASIRAAGIKSINRGKGGLGASEDHGKRLDETSRRRIVMDRKSLNWSKAGEGKGLELIEAFKAHKKEFGAKERKNCEIGTHLLVTVSPEWIAEAGDIHDEANPHIEKLINEAVNWAESWQGKGAVFAWRFDLDEKGSGVVDLFTAPVREQGRRGGKRVNTIAPSQAKDELCKTAGEKTSGSAMQTSWAVWTQDHLDPRFERGKRKKETGREHVHAEVYAKEAEKACAEARRDALEAQEASRRLGRLREEEEAIQKRLQWLKEENERLEEIKKSIEDPIQEIHKLQKQIKGWNAFWNLVQKNFKSLFPSQYEALANIVRPIWEVDPDNPNRKPEPPKPVYTPSSFSP